ncbi:hypothetical protein ACUYOF_07705 [Photobacterium ganghwense]|uniref:hypothetical protein n=1 Tax=Photobacterium ganghwense TaxID=320778 RepID=UPI0040569897
MFRSEFNGCKSFGCDNLGNPDLALYTYSERLGYPAYHCPLCGAYPPVLHNAPIIQLTKQIYSPVAMHLHWPRCRCTPQRFAFVANAKDVHHANFATKLASQTLTKQEPARWIKYGHTSSGTPRVRCLQCLGVTSLLNPLSLSRSLQPLLTALLVAFRNNEPLETALTSLSLSNKVLYEKLGKLQQLLEHASRCYERQWFSTLPTITIQTHSTVSHCRSGLQGYDSTACWYLSTAESRTGYQILISDNLLLNNVRSDAHQTGRYLLDYVEPDMAATQSVFEKARLTYERIMSRSQFDQRGYCLQQHAASKEGTVLRPVYSAHAHMQTLQALLPPNKPLAMVLEHESFLRGAAITTFAESVRLQTTQLYYLHALPRSIHSEATKHYLANNNQQPVNKPVSDIQQSNLHPINVQQSNLQQSDKQILSWWQESWHQYDHYFPAKSGSTAWSLGIGVLTGKTANEKTPKGTATEQLASLLVPTHPKWHEDFWSTFEQWLPEQQRHRLSHQRVSQWLGIFRYIYNFCQQPASNGAAPGSNNHVVPATRTKPTFEPTHIASIAEYINSQPLKQSH